MVMKKFQRMTRQREVILRELCKLTSHPTAADLYEVVRRHLPRISLGTVYRNLELLAKNGNIQKLERGGGQARFDGNADQHYHVRCVRCGRVDDVHDVPGEVLGGHCTELEGYKILGRRLEFLGICPQCGRTKGPEQSRTYS